MRHSSAERRRWVEPGPAQAPLDLGQVGEVLVEDQAEAHRPRLDVQDRGPGVGSSAEGTRWATKKVSTHSSGVGPGVAVMALRASLR